jgi:hypothetical protein
MPKFASASDVEATLPSLLHRGSAREMGQRLPSRE